MRGREKSSWRKPHAFGVADRERPWRVESGESRVESGARQGRAGVERNGRGRREPDAFGGRGSGVGNGHGRTARGADVRPAEGRAVRPSSPLCALSVSVVHVGSGDGDRADGQVGVRESCGESGESGCGMASERTVTGGGWRESQVLKALKALSPRPMQASVW
jgi:hypothetical protein